jgi:hypothetical protein
MSIIDSIRTKKSFQEIRNDYKTTEYNKSHYNDFVIYTIYIIIIFMVLMSLGICIIINKKLINNN